MQDFTNTRSWVLGLLAASSETKCVFLIPYALQAGFSMDDVFYPTKIDRWFLTQIKAIVDLAEELAGAKN